MQPLCKAAFNAEQVSGKFHTACHALATPTRRDGRSANRLSVIGMGCRPAPGMVMRAVAAGPIGRGPRTTDRRPRRLSCLGSCVGVGRLVEHVFPREHNWATVYFFEIFVHALPQFRL